MEFKYEELFQMGEDATKYHLVTKDYVSTAQFEGEEILKVDPEGLRLIARQAFHDVAFMLRWPGFSMTPRPAATIRPWP